MHKRGQVTVFVILGILIIVVLAVIFYLYSLQSKLPLEKQPQFDFSRTDALKNYIEDCIKIKGNEAINLVRKQGGDINPGFYLSYKFPNTNEFDKLTYLCYTTTYTACTVQRPLLNKHVSDEITSYLNNHLRSCIDNGLQQFRQQGYTINEQWQNAKINTSINKFNVIISLDYPIEIAKGTSSSRQDKFSYTFDNPLGKLIEITEYIIHKEVTEGEFYTIPYMIRERRVLIEKYRPGYSKAYKITYFDLNFNEQSYFQFAIQNYVY